MPSWTPKPILRGAVPTSAPSLGSPAYTVPANTATHIRAFDFTNTTGAAITVTVWLVPSGAGSVLSSHQYISGASVLPTGMPPDADERVVVLSAGDMIFLQASGAGLNVYASGAEEVLV
jgi:hypothetical protein